MNINLTLIGQLLSFIVFVWFTMKYVWTPIMGALEKRRKEIAEGLAAGERGQHEQELAKERAKEVLKDAKLQASDILAQAQKRASEIVDDAKGQAREEGERLLLASRTEIDQEVNRAREDLRERVAALAVAGAEKILQREVNPEVHQNIINELAKEI